MKVGDWEIESVVKPTTKDVAFVGFPPTVYGLSFTINGRTFMETIILYEPPSQEAINNAINQTIQRLELTLDMENRNG